MVNDFDNFALFGDALAGPGEVALGKTKGSEFEVSSANSDSPDALFTGLELSHGGLSSFLEGSLLLVNRHATSRKSSFVSAVS